MFHSALPPDLFLRNDGLLLLPHARQQAITLGRQRCECCRPLSVVNCSEIAGNLCPEDIARRVRVTSSVEIPFRLILELR